MPLRTMNQNNHNAANNSMPFSAVQPTSIIPLKYPCFSVNHYNEPCSSSVYQNRTSSGAFVRIGKRKNNSSLNESMFHPLTKQQITEARIAASMQMLSLENSLVTNESVHATKRTEDEGFCDDLNIECEERDVTDDETEDDKIPQYKLVGDVVNEGFNEMMNSILPEQIYRTMNQSCLALIPYVPPSNVLSIASRDETTLGKSAKDLELELEAEMKHEVSVEESMLY